MKSRERKLDDQIDALNRIIVNRNRDLRLRDERLAELEVVLKTIADAIAIQLGKRDHPDTKRLDWLDERLKENKITEFGVTRSELADDIYIGWDLNENTMFENLRDLIDWHTEGGE